MQHLLDLPNAKTQLTLWKADLSDEGSYDDAINGCDGVFHIATPMDFESKDPEVIELYYEPFDLFISTQQDFVVTEFVGIRTK